MKFASLIFRKMWRNKRRMLLTIFSIGVSLFPTSMLVDGLACPPGTSLSFRIESITLATLGGILGCLMALPAHGIFTGTTNFNNFAEVVFQFRVMPLLMAEGIAFASVMGAICGLKPARLAACIPPVRALREA